jgi:hypothetical protein
MHCQDGGNFQNGGSYFLTVQYKLSISNRFQQINAFWKCLAIFFQEKKNMIFQDGDFFHQFSTDFYRKMLFRNVLQLGSESAKIGSQWSETAMFIVEIL